MERTSGGGLQGRRVRAGFIEQRQRRWQLIIGYGKLELPDRRQVIEIVWSDRACRQTPEFHHPMARRDLRAYRSLDQADEGLRAAKLSGELLLRPTLQLSPFREPHAPIPRAGAEPLNCNLQYQLARYKRSGAADYNVLSFNLLFMEPGNRLRELRQSAKLTQAELAEKTGVSQPAISQLENGTRPMDIAWMRTFARALGCAPADLLDAEDNPYLLDPHELELLERYRHGDQGQRDTLERVAAAVVPLGDEGAEAA